MKETTRNVLLPALLLLSGLGSTALSAPVEVYSDSETGNEVWRMTSDPAKDMMQYYDWPTMSPNGRYLIFRTNRAPYLWIINSDGSGEQAIGSLSVWSSQRGVDFSTNTMQGWWSHDSRHYYVFKQLYVIDIETFLADPAAAATTTT